MIGKILCMIGLHQWWTYHPYFFTGAKWSEIPMTCGRCKKERNGGMSAPLNPKK